MSENIFYKFLNPTFYQLLLQVIEKVDPKFHSFILANWPKVFGGFVLIAVFKDLVDFYKECRDSGLNISSIDLKNPQFYRKFPKLVLILTKACFVIGFKRRLALIIQILAISVTYGAAFWRDGARGMKEELNHGAVGLFKLWLDYALSLFKAAQTTMTEQQVETLKSKLITECETVIFSMVSALTYHPSSS